MAAFIDSLMSMASRGFKPFLQKNSLIQFTRQDKSKFIQIEGKSVVPRVRPNRNCSTQLCNKDVDIQHLLPPLLRSFRTTIARNASKLTNKLNGARGLTKRNFFYKDYLGRRARYSGYLFSFGGLAFMQDQLYEEAEEREIHFQSYMNLCTSIKDMFNSTETISNQTKDKLINWGNYTVGSELCIKENSTVYEFNKSETTTESDTESFAFDSLDSSASFEVLSHKSAEIAEVEDTNYTVEVVKSKKQSLALPFINNKSSHANKGGSLYRGKFNSNLISQWIDGKIGYHPNIVMVEHLFEVDADEAKYFVEFNMKMEFMFRLDQPNTNDLCLVTKRYDQTLKSFIAGYVMEEETSMVIILQLLEAVSFLRSNFAVHRKICPETIYVEHNDGTYPRVLLGDFIDAFQVNSESEMLVPFEHISFDTRVPFNLWQAPEIISAKPGKGKYIDYRNSDVWSVGIIASLLLDGNKSSLRETTEMSNSTQESREFNSLFLASLLNPDPQVRLTAAEAGDILHLQVFATFAPEEQTTHDQVNPDYAIYDEISDWLTIHCVDGLFRKHDDEVLHDLCSSFFKRLDVKRLAVASVMWGELCVRV